MKKTILATVTAVVLGTTISGLALAKGGDFGRGDHNPVERMSQALELTDEQKVQLEELFAGQSEQRQQLRDQFQSQIDEILTPEQIELKAQMQAPHGDREGHRYGHHGDRDGGHEGRGMDDDHGRGKCH